MMLQRSFGSQRRYIKMIEVDEDTDLHFDAAMQNVHVIVPGAQVPPGPWQDDFRTAFLMLMGLLGKLL